MRPLAQWSRNDPRRFPAAILASPPRIILDKVVSHEILRMFLKMRALTKKNVPKFASDFRAHLQKASDRLADLLDIVAVAPG
jgi:hypothetical protein